MYFDKCNTLRELDEARDKILNQITNEYTARRRYISNVEIQSGGGSIFRRKSLKSILEGKPKINTPLGGVVTGKVPPNKIIINNQGVSL